VGIILLANLKVLFWEDQKADGWTQNYFYRGLEIILYQVSINERKVRKPVVLFSRFTGYNPLFLKPLMADSTVVAFSQADLNTSANFAS
jgi:hypothetical protein